MPGSESQRNAQRRGFQVAYTRTTLLQESKQHFAGKRQRRHYLSLVAHTAFSEPLTVRPGSIPQEIVDSDAVGCGSEPTVGFQAQECRLRVKLAVGRILEQWKKIVSNIYPFLPKLTMNGQFIRDFIAAESPVLCTRPSRRAETTVRFFGAPTGRSHPTRNLRGWIQFWSRLAQDC